MINEPFKKTKIFISSSGLSKKITIFSGGRVDSRGAHCFNPEDYLKLEPFIGKIEVRIDLKEIEEKKQHAILSNATITAVDKNEVEIKAEKIEIS